MTREIAKGICQQFMDARLIENAIDPTAPLFKDRGIHSITPKGLHVLERFITKNGIGADHLVKVFTTQPICMRLLHLERRANDDDIIVTRPVLEVVFKRFIGVKSPNYITDAMEVSQAAAAGMSRSFVESVRPPINFERGSGIEMQDVAEKIRNGNMIVVKHVFSSAGAIDWLCDHSTCCCRDEAAELLAHFVRYGFMALYWDKTKSETSTTPQIKTGGSSPEGSHVEAEFRWGPKVTYKVTDDGRRLANWDGLSGGEKVSEAKKVSSESTLDNVDSSASNRRSVFGAPTHGAQVDENATNSSGTGGSSVTGSTGGGIGNGGEAGMSGAFSGMRSGGEWSLAGGFGVGSMLDSKLLTKTTLREIFEVDLSDDSAWNKEGQHSSTTRLRAILDDIRLRALFRDYLKNNYCEENLGFWLDVQDFRRRFSTTSSAIGGSPHNSSGATSSGKDTSSLGSNHHHHHHAEKEKPPRKPLLRGTFSSSSSSSPTLTAVNGTASNAMEAHQNDLNIAAVNIYRLYLAPHSASELNIDHNLRADVVNFIQKCADEAGIPSSSISAQRNNIVPTGISSHSTLIPFSSLTPTISGTTLSGQSPYQQQQQQQQGLGQGQQGQGGAGTSPEVSPDPNSLEPSGPMQMMTERRVILPLRATQVQTLLRYYERIQDHIFRLLATDQVPKFSRTPEFLILLKGNQPVSCHSIRESL